MSDSGFGYGEHIFFGFKHVKLFHLLTLHRNKDKSCS